MKGCHIRAPIGNTGHVFYKWVVTWVEQAHLFFGEVVARHSHEYMLVSMFGSEITTPEMAIRRAPFRNNVLPAFTS